MVHEKNLFGFLTKSLSELLLGLWFDTWYLCFIITVSLYLYSVISPYVLFLPMLDSYTCWTSSIVWITPNVRHSKGFGVRLSFSPRIWGSTPQQIFKSHRIFRLRPTILLTFCLVWARKAGPPGRRHPPCVAL